MGVRQTLLFLFSVISLVACVTQNAAASLAVARPLPRSFAVFVVASNAEGEVRGGVAGTAFFTTPHRAVTAYHVLQPKSFQVPVGYSRQRVWLLHENETPIELKESYARFDSKNDLTVVDLPQAVATEFVYPTGAGVLVGDPVATEGFRANTAGPRLSRSGADVDVIDVPHLERVNLVGQFISRARVELRAIDVTLESTPCLQVDFEPVRGISGGPLLAGGRVIGVNSFGDPREARRTWSITIETLQAGPTLN